MVNGKFQILPPLPFFLETFPWGPDSININITSLKTNESQTTIGVNNNTIVNSEYNNKWTQKYKMHKYKKCILLFFPET